MSEIILASASPRRTELLRQLIPRFAVIPSSAPEMIKAARAPELAALNAQRKAAEIASRFPEALVIGADTLVYWDGRIFGKPAGLEEAGRMLAALQGRTHQVVTGVCLKRNASEKTFSEITEVTFRPLGPVQIADYLRRVDPLDKAGAYAIQENGDQIVAGIRGSYSNVVGLPLERLKRELRDFKAAG